MKRLLVVLMAAGLFSAAAQADLDLTGGNLYADAGAGNTTFADGSSPWSAGGGSPTANLWWERTGYGYDDAGVVGGDINESLPDITYWRNNGPVQGVKTTVSGLVDGQVYDVYVIYGSKHVGENWNVTADFSPIATGDDGVVTSGITYGAADATLLGVTVTAGESIEQNGTSGIYQFKGLIGTITGDAGGMLDVYVDDLSNLAGANERAWYDGIYLQAVPEPATLVLLGLGGLLLRRNR